MLLEFKCKNYKSFKEELCFSMRPHPYQKGLDYSIQKTLIDKNIYKSLCSAVIYGPNASGKTNVISAMDTFKRIVLRGNLNNSSDIPLNIAAAKLELIPNYSVNEPVFFYIEFIFDNTLFMYTVTLDLGRFLIKDYDRKVLKEVLFVNNKELFSRENDTISFDRDAYNYDVTIEKVFDKAELLAQSNLKSDELFLMNGFKTIFSKKLVEQITDWFEHHFDIVVRADAIQTRPFTAGVEEDEFFFETNLENALREFGVYANKIAYKTSKDGNASLYSLIKADDAAQTFNALPARLFESYGTIRFINEFPIIAQALTRGGTLVIDEFDASIHPVALMSIISVFHNDEINKKHAQLILNTHNPIFLDHTLFRRDEIKFVEFDRENQTSVSYSLSDFNTSETTGTRKNSDYMKNYFVNRYGAISNVDFSSVFEELMNSLSEENVDEE